MTGLDWVLSAIGLLAFIAFTGTVASLVPDPDLLAVIAIAVAMAVYDFWIRPLRRKRK